MNHNFNRKIKKMDVVELFRAAQEGNDTALTELIDRQQEGRALRYYPDGRDGAEDEGVVPVKIESKDGSLCIRSGRPNQRILVDKSTIEKWITGIPECLFHAASEHKKNGVSSEDVFDLMTEKATPNFRAEISATVGEDESVTCNFMPHGESVWIVPPSQAGSILKKLLEACSKNGWEFDITDDEVKAVQALVSIAG